MHIYKIILMHGSPVFCSSNDVAKLTVAANSGARFVYIRGRLVNPSIVATVEPYWTEQGESVGNLLGSGDEFLEKALEGAGAIQVGGQDDNRLIG